MGLSTHRAWCLAFASALLIGVSAPAIVPLSHSAAFAQDKKATQPEKKLTTTTTADNSYGEGGTKLTTSDDKFKVTQEQFKDKNGDVREVRMYEDNGSVVTFLYQDKKLVGGYTVTPKDADKPDGEWEFTGNAHGTVVRQTFKSRDEALQRAEAASQQFAKNGEIQDTPTNVVPPTLTPRPPQQQAAPKSCGEIADEQTQIAMGCLPSPNRRPTAVNTGNRPAAATPAAKTQETDCFSDAVCREELERQERLRDPSSRRAMPPGGPEPGGMMMPRF